MELADRTPTPVKIEAEKQAVSSSTRASGTLSRAHVRFLRLAIPHARPVSGTVRALAFSRACYGQLEAHIATAGEFRCGVLLGRETSDTLQVSGVMSGGYPPYGRPGLAGIDASYVLGLVDGARLADSTTDWVGLWVMAASGDRLSPADQHDVMAQARQIGLCGHDFPLVFIARGVAEFDLTAWAGDAEGHHELPIAFHRAD